MVPVLSAPCAASPLHVDAAPRTPRIVPKQSNPKAAWSPARAADSAEQFMPVLPPLCMPVVVAPLRDAVQAANRAPSQMVVPTGPCRGLCRQRTEQKKLLPVLAGPCRQSGSNSSSPERKGPPAETRCRGCHIAGPLAAPHLLLTGRTGAILRASEG